MSATPLLDGPGDGSVPHVIGRPQRRVLHRFLNDRLAVAGLAWLLLVTLGALFADVIVPLDPLKTNLVDRFALPLSDGHLLGSDDLGRDLFSRVVHGAQISLLAGAASVLVALVIAVPVGLVAGYSGGRVERLALRGVDVLLSIPPLILVFAIAGILGPNLRNVVVALAVYFTPLFIRLVVTEARRMRQSDLVEAARAVGSPDAFIMARHVLPNIASPIIVQGALSVGVAIIAEASLSFLGLGVRPPTPSWGVMLRGAFDFIQREPWMLFVPASAMALTVMAFNLVGDGLRNAIGRVQR